MHGLQSIFDGIAGYGSFPTEGCIPDTVNGAKFIRDLYEKVDDEVGFILDSERTV